MSTPAAKKVGLSNSIRTNLNEQLVKLSLKQNAELNLLESFRAFVTRKSALEKEYALNLQRLVQQFSVKEEGTAVNGGVSNSSNRGVLEIWKVMLDRTEAMAKSLSTAADLLTTKVAESLKQQKKFKEQLYRKHLDVAQKMNSEILESLKELTTAKKTYMDLEKLCQDTRQKFTEAENRAKSKKEKRAQELVKKQAERLKACQKRAAVSRNDYLLALVTTNTHLRLHAQQYLPALMKAMDGDMYDKLRDAYMTVAQIQLDVWMVVKADFEDFRDQAALVNREYVLERFTASHPVLKDVHTFEFEPFGQDQVCAISKEHGSEIFLDKDARNWALNLTKCNSSIMENEKLLKGLQSVVTAYTKTPEFGNAAAFSEAHQKSDVIAEEIRHLNVMRSKAEARLEALREVGVDVAKWLQKADDQEQGTSDRLDVNDTRRLSGSALSLQAGGSQEICNDPTDTRSAADFEVSSMNSENISTTEAVKYCQVIFDYKAQRPDEIDVHVDEVLTILEWDDGDGWCKGRNARGLEGFFPQNYVQPTSKSPTPTSRETTPTNSETIPTNSVTNGKDHSIGGTGIYLRALYEYTRQGDEELTFPEGAIIELVNKSVSGIDDGWWEGSYGGKTGLFPSVVVELIQDQCTTAISLQDTTLVSSWGGDMPPSESPPPVPPDYPAPDISPHDLGFGDSFPSIHLAPKPSNTFFNSGRMDNGVAKSTCPAPFQNKTSSPMVPKASLPDLRIKSPSPVVGRSPMRSDSTNSFDDDSFEASLV